MAFTIKQNDTKPALIAILQELDGTPIDLTSATGIEIVVKSAEGAFQWKKTATFVDKPEGQVQYTWESADTAAAGTYNAEFEITWPDGIQTVPNDNYFQIIVVEDLG
jgi:hypothetical protein